MKLLLLSPAIAVRPGIPCKIQIQLRIVADYFFSNSRMRSQPILDELFFSLVNHSHILHVISDCQKTT